MVTPDVIAVYLISAGKNYEDSHKKKKELLIKNREKGDWVFFM